MFLTQIAEHFLPTSLGLSGKSFFDCALLVQALEKAFLRATIRNRVGMLLFEIFRNCKNEINYVRH